jgi:hypothetical protein
MNPKLMLTPINIGKRPPVLFLWHPIGSPIYLQLQVLRVGQRRTDQDLDGEIPWAHRDSAAVSRLLDPGLKRDGHFSGSEGRFDRVCLMGFGGIEGPYVVALY